MKRSEALQIVALLNAAFPRDALEGPSLELFAAEVGLLHDAQTGADAARLIARNRDRFPSIREIRETYKSIAESRRPRELDPAPGFTVVPEWVHVWWWLRWVREPAEWRSLPQQRDGLADEPFMAQEDYEAYRAEWVKAGSPQVSPGQIASMAA